MLLQDEAQLSAPSKISTVLALSQSTSFYSHNPVTIRLGFCSPNLITFANAYLPCIHMWELLKLHQAWLLCNHEHLVGLQGKRGKSSVPLPAETPELCSICPNFILMSGVCPAPPTGNDKLKLLAIAAGGSSLGRKPDLTVPDCFLSHWEVRDAAYFALQDF